MIDSLRAMHHSLEQRVEAELVDSALIDEVERFIGKCTEAGRDIPHLDDREELRSILSHWSMFLVDKAKVPGAFDLKLEAPTLGFTTLRYTFGDLVTRCSQQAGKFVDEQGPIYKPEWAVRRAYIEKELWRFLRSERMELPLTGSAGVGKTFLICQLARSQPWKANGDLALILPYDCYSLSTALSLSGLGLKTDIEHHIIRSLGLDGLASLGDEVGYIDRLLEQNGAYLLICFDSVERFFVNRIEEPGEEFGPVPRTRELLLCLNAIAKDLFRRGATRVKFLFTCVNSTWLDLAPETLLQRSLCFTPNSDLFSLLMEKFNDIEFQEAYAAYEIPEITLDESRQLSRRIPYLLRLLSDELQRRRREKKGFDVKDDELFSRFYNERVLRDHQKEQIEKHRFLVGFAKRLARFQANREELWGVSAGEIDTTDPAYDQLKLDGIIEQTKIRTPSPDIVITLNPLELAEFIRVWFEGSLTP